MIAAALADTGLPPEAAIMIGDTSFDMEMARAAGAGAAGVAGATTIRPRCGAPGAYYFRGFQ